LLLPVLTATAEKNPAGTVRVVNVSSLAHYLSPSEGIRWATLATGNDALAARKNLGMAKLYGQSKLVRYTNAAGSHPMLILVVRETSSLLMSLLGVMVVKA